MAKRASCRTRDGPRIRRDARFYVAPSTLPGAGGGLFARTALCRGECIPYVGERVTASEIRAPAFVRGYVIKTGSGFIDARDPRGQLVMDDGSAVRVAEWTDSQWRANMRRVRGVAWRGTANLARFINSGDRTHPNNCILTRSCGGGSAYKLKRDVQADEELLVSYGPSFWESHNDNHCYKCSRDGFLVECDGCNRSYHLKCAGIRDEKALPSGEWFCEHCARRRGVERAPKAKSKCKAPSSGAPSRPQRKAR